MRTATYRPGRSVLSIAVIASATFILISVEAFRRGDRLADTGPRSGVGGYDLIVETLLPIVRDPNTREGREALNLFDLDPSVAFEPLRLLPGDDASCLNLYEPRNPRIVAAERRLPARRAVRLSRLAGDDRRRARQSVAAARTGPSRTARFRSSRDANSMTYVLHKKLGDDIVLHARRTRQVRLRLVAALSDSIFQGELLMAEQPFSKLFPEQQGYQVLLVRAGNEPVDRLEARARRRDGRSRRARHRNRRTAGAVSPRREHVSLDLSDARRARAAARHVRARHRAPAQRAGAEARAGAARGRGLPSRARDDDGRGGERAAAGRGSGSRCALGRAGDCAGRRRARQPSSVHERERAADGRGVS